MRYARMIDGVLASEGVLPPDLRDATVDDQRAAGYYAILTDPPKPPDTATTTHNRSFDVASGSIVWVERAKTADEVARSTATANESLLRQQVADHLADLRLIAGSSGTLTGVQLSNAVRVLARGQIRLIRLAVGLLDGTD